MSLSILQQRIHGLERARLVFEHHGNAVANRDKRAGRRGRSAAAVPSRTAGALAERTGQDVEQFGVHGRSGNVSRPNRISRSIFARRRSSSRWMACASASLDRSVQAHRPAIREPRSAAPGRHFTASFSVISTGASSRKSNVRLGQPRMVRQRARIDRQAQPPTAHRKTPEDCRCRRWRALRLPRQSSVMGGALPCRATLHLQVPAWRRPLWKRFVLPESRLERRVKHFQVDTVQSGRAARATGPGRQQAAVAQPRRSSITAISSIAHPDDSAAKPSSHTMICAPRSMARLASATRSGLTAQTRSGSLGQQHCFVAHFRSGSFVVSSSREPLSRCATVTTQHDARAQTTARLQAFSEPDGHRSFTSAADRDVADRRSPAATHAKRLRPTALDKPSVRKAAIDSRTTTTTAAATMRTTATRVQSRDSL